MPTNGPPRKTSSGASKNQVKSKRKGEKGQTPDLSGMSFDDIVVRGAGKHSGQSARGTAATTNKNKLATKERIRAGLEEDARKKAQTEGRVSTMGEKMRKRGVGSGRVYSPDSRKSKIRGLVVSNDPQPSDQQSKGQPTQVKGKGPNLEGLFAGGIELDLCRLTDDEEVRINNARRAMAENSKAVKAIVSASLSGTRRTEGKFEEPAKEQEKPKRKRKPRHKYGGSRRKGPPQSEK